MATLITPEFRASFVFLVEPRLPPNPGPGAKPAYSLAVAIPKSEKKFLAQLDQAIEDTAKEKWGKIPPKLKTPLRDGDEEERPEFEDCIVFNTKSEARPQIVDTDLQEIIDPDVLYSGAWYRVSVNPFAWDHPTGGKGVSFGLNNVMWVKDDEPYSGRKKAAEDFANV